MANDARNTMDDAQAQIVRLREQVEALMKDRVTPAMANYADRAEHAYNAASGAVRGQAEMVTGRIKDQPLIAIIIAAAAGWLIGRVMR
jgi:ElaB/YqjD/DUF883 family membrane-anchored ribosome-binding protein